MTIKLDLTAAQQSTFLRQARQKGQAITEYVSDLLDETAANSDKAQSLASPRPNRQAALALLHDLAETDIYGTAEQQRAGLEYIKRAIDSDRPGQRSIFGAGKNPS